MKRSRYFENLFDIDHNCMTKKIKSCLHWIRRFISPYVKSFMYLFLPYLNGLFINGCNATPGKCSISYCKHEILSKSKLGLTQVIMIFLSMKCHRYIEKIYKVLDYMFI